MSTDQWNKKVQQVNKLINSLKKDLKFREDQAKRGEATFSIDAQIGPSFRQLKESNNQLSKYVTSYQANGKEFGLTGKEVEKRQKDYQRFRNQQTTLKRTYDSYFQKKVSSKDLMGEQPEKQMARKPDPHTMTKEQLRNLKQQQEKEQDQALDDLIGTVKGIKTGAKAVGKEVEQQDAMLKQLDNAMDDNTQKMGTVRKKLVKLLQSSSNWCLILAIILELAALFCILFLWS